MIYLIFWIKKDPDGHESRQVVRLVPTLIKHVHCQALDFLSQAKLLTWNFKSTAKAYDCKITFWENLYALWQGIMLHVSCEFGGTTSSSLQQVNSLLNLPIQSQPHEPWYTDPDQMCSTTGWKCPEIFQVPNASVICLFLCWMRTIL